MNEYSSEFIYFFLEFGWFFLSQQKLLLYLFCFFCDIISMSVYYHYIILFRRSIIFQEVFFCQVLLGFWVVKIGKSFYRAGICQKEWNNQFVMCQFYIAMQMETYLSLRSRPVDGKIGSAYAEFCGQLS